MSGSGESSKSLINSGLQHQFQETSNELIAAASGHTDLPRMTVPALFKRQSSLKPPISTTALIRSTSGIGGAILGGTGNAIDVDASDKLESMVVEAMDEEGDEQQLVEGTDSESSSDVDGDEYWVAEEILQSKVENGKNQYLIRWDGYGSEEDSWEPEDHIVDTKLLTSFYAKSKREKRVDTDDEEYGAKRTPKRPRKKRATENRPSDENAGEGTAGTSGRKKTSKKQERVRKISAKATKKALALQEIQDRVSVRSSLTPPPFTGFDVDPSLPPSALDTSCCMVCSVREYTRAIANSDSALFDAAMAAKKEVSAWYLYARPDLPHDTPILHAIVSNDLGTVQQLVKAMVQSDRVRAPFRYLNSDSGGTGYHSGRVFSHRTRAVNESRGNREGNTAFYKKNETEPMEVHSQKGRLFNNVRMLTVLYAMRDPRTTPDMVDLLMLEDVAFKEYVTQWGLYEAAAAGNRALAAHLVENMMNGFGFNHLHMEVLKFISNEKLTSYRHNQILKMATGNHNVNPLEMAAINPNAQYLEALFDELSPAETTTQDRLGRTVAHFAVACEGTGPLEFLIERRFDFTSPDTSKMTPLLLCAKYGRATNLRLLIPYLGGADATKVTLLKQGWTALHFAAHYGRAEACRALLELGAVPDILDKETKATPLMHASKMGHIEVVRVLLEAGANPHAVDKFKRTSLHLAAKNGWFDTSVELLRRGCDADAKDTSNNVYFIYFATFLNPRISEHGEFIFIAKVDFLTIPATSALRSCTRLGNTGEAADRFRWRRSQRCEQLEDISMRDCRHERSYESRQLHSQKPDREHKDGRTMLHKCCSENFSSFYEAKRVVDKALLLCSRGADPNIQDVDGNTVLHMLTLADHTIDIEKDLMELISPPIDNQGLAEPEAVFSDEDVVRTQVEMARLLIQYGADVNLLDKDKKPPLELAVEGNNMDMIVFLIQNGADVFRTFRGTGDNIFHFFLKAAAEAENMETEQEEKKNRLENKIKVIWDSLMMRMMETSVDDQRALVNAVNDEGYSPILLGFVHCMNLQYNSIDLKKKYIHQVLSGWPNSYRIMEEYSEIKLIDLRYKWQFWISCTKKFIEAFAPDMNTTKQLPKIFFEKNPKATIKDHPERTGWGLLHFAGNLQEPTIIEFFLSNGSAANITVEGHDDERTPIMYAVMLDENEEDYMLPETQEKLNEKFSILKDSKSQAWISSARILLENGADPFKADRNGDTALMFAAGQQNDTVLQIILEMSIKQGLEPAVDVNRANEKKETALMKAITTLDLQFEESDPLQALTQFNKISKLLEAGADVSAVDEDHESILIKAIRCKLPGLVDLILSTPRPVDMRLQNKHDETALIVACKMDDADSVDSLLARPGISGEDVLVDITDKWSNTALFIATQNSNARIVKVLLEKCHADPDSAVYKSTGSTPLIEAIRKKSLEIIKLLLKAGANVNVCDKNGTWVLHHGANSQNAQIVEILLNTGSSVNITDKDGHTPLHYAIQNSKSHTNTSLKIERLLLKNFANVNAVDYQGRTPLHIAFIDIHTIPQMKTTRLEKEKIDKQKKIMDRLNARELELHSFVNKYSANDYNLTEWLLEGKRKEMEKNPEADYDEGFAMTYSKGIYRKDQWEKYNSESDVIKGDPIEIVSFLLASKDIQIDVVDRFGRTPLHYAARLGAFTCSSYLLDRGALVNADDLDYNTPLQIALMYNHVDYSVMLGNKDAEVLRDVTLPNGDSLSTFNRSLSKSFMSLAYLIMEKGVELIGKFHLALLLISKADQPMLQQLNSNGQNMFHIIGNFHPFDKAIWDEYIPEAFEILLANGLDYNLPDKFNRTPLHYAAKFGHEILVKLLLDNKVAVDLIDMDGRTPLWYAVTANSADSFYAIFDHQPDVNLGNEIASHSILYNAVQSGNLKIVKTLLDNGARWDSDAQNGRQNAVMKAVLDDKKEILEALIKAGADINETSVVTYFEKEGKKEQRQMHPIVISITSSFEIFKLLLHNGADPNVFDFFKGNQMTPLMISLAKKDYVRIEYLINHKASNAEYILQLMWSASPNVSHVDEKTGQTPLEYAIRRKDTKLLKLLLDHNADINIPSCVKRFTGLYKKPVTALVHAIYENNLEAVKIILEHPLAKQKLNIEAVDELGRNCVFYVVSPFATLSFENIELLNLLVKSDRPGPLIGSTSSLLDHVDLFGKRPIHYAYQQSSKKMYAALLELGATPLSQAEMAIIDDMDAGMEIDLLEPMDVDTDAQKARVAIEEAEELEEAKKNGDLDENGRPKKKKIVEVDPHSGLEDIGEVLMEGEDGFDIMLNRTDVDKGYYGENLFYKMQVIHNKVQDLYILFTRWGGIGETGMFQKTPFNSKAEAVDEFKKIFKNKTANPWELRFSNEFVERDGRFVVTKLAEKKKSVVLKPLDLSKSPKSTLPHSLQDTLKIFCDVASMNKMVNDSQLNLPLGCLSRATIEEGHQLLTEIRNEIQLMVTKQAIGTIRNTTPDIKIIKAIRHKLVQLSNQYYTRIPNNQYISTGIRPFIDLKTVEIEMRRLSNIRYLNSGANILLGAELRSGQINPLDYCYRALQCRMEEVETETEEYNVVSRYMNTTANSDDYEIIHLFGLERSGERENFKLNLHDENRRLLWHGSRLSNFMGILSQGLRVTPAEAIASGYGFGKGIYFADMFRKSIAYTREWETATATKAYSCMLLCEVALGDMYECEEFEYMETAKPGFFSTKGLGKEGPEDNMSLHASKDGLIIPQGPSVKYEYTRRQNGYGEKIERTLHHSEYIVYDTAQVQMRYLVLVRDKKYCFLCNNSVGLNSVAPLKDYKFKSLPDGLLEGNEYERLIAEIYLRHAGISPQELFNTQLDAWVLKPEKYNMKWHPVTQLLPTSKICSSCANCVMSILIYEMLRYNMDKLPEKVATRLHCWYGSECRLQGNLDHAMQYNHICRRTKFDSVKDEAKKRKRVD
ncbi:hypothetical protein BC937DRAFT_88542 [Endogone sp. FLAS-F59071]|nr:hypothetical protein BC937DRAFT_88542 [Endogone sp. FLAS-F59071]|eukprot:RUS22547.1 hypothetical protein BC937DRAFT_88542 [Endogone sp. FLAS-F59071]